MVLAKFVFLLGVVYSSSSDFAFFSRLEIEGCLPAIVPSFATANNLSVSFDMLYSRSSFIWVGLEFGLLGELEGLGLFTRTELIK